MLRAVLAFHYPCCFLHRRRVWCEGLAQQGINTKFRNSNSGQRLVYVVRPSHRRHNDTSTAKHFPDFAQEEQDGKAATRTRVLMITTAANAPPDRTQQLRVTSATINAITSCITRILRVILMEYSLGCPNAKNEKFFFYFKKKNTKNVHLRHLCLNYLTVIMNKSPYKLSTPI